MKTKLFFTGLALMALTVLASAQNNGLDKNLQNPSGKGLAYVDANKNGICDNFENRITTVPAGNRNCNCRGCVQGKQNGKQNGKGMGQGMGQGMGRVWDPGKEWLGDRGDPETLWTQIKTGYATIRKHLQINKLLILDYERRFITFALDLILIYGPPTEMQKNL